MAPYKTEQSQRVFPADQKQTQELDRCPDSQSPPCRVVSGAATEGGERWYGGPLTLRGMAGAQESECRSHASGM